MAFAILLVGALTAFLEMAETDAELRVRVALAIATAQQPKAQQPPPIQDLWPDYWWASNRAISANKPLVMFVGVRPRAIAGSVVGEQGDYQQPGPLKPPGYPPVCIVVSVPVGKELHWRATLPVTASDADIRRAIAGPPSTPLETAAKAVQPVAQIFTQSPAGRDGDLEGLEFLAEMEPYTSARLAQVSGNRSGRGANWAVDRSTLGAKWMVPGGLEGVTGWTNQLYRKPGNPVRNWFGRADPSDTYRTTDGDLWGSEFIHQRQYGEGAMFADVISTDRGVFEARVAVMKGGTWKRSVVYRNRDAAPDGYKRVAIAKCVACHDGGMANSDAPGSGAYGSARIPGGGGVYSEPLVGVEQ